jgi:hypothetical protein
MSIEIVETEASSYSHTRLGEYADTGTDVLVWGLPSVEVCTSGL